MSIFGRIKDAIFGSAAAQESPQAPSVAPPAQGAAAAPTASGTATSTVQGTASASAGTAAPMSQVDVEAVLTDLAAKKGQKLDWRKSIVDLMKLLDLDSSLDARKDLAKELNYTGDTSDSATMNIWLHKQVMSKLAASGGKVPDDLRS
jgi:3-oxoacyl-ACP reductase-like protein